jgi:hypothetical protein
LQHQSNRRRRRPGGRLCGDVELIEFKPVGSAEDSIGVHIPGDSNHVKHGDFPQFIALSTLNAAGHERVGIRARCGVLNGSDFKLWVYSRALCGSYDDEQAKGGKSHDFRQCLSH